MNLALVLGTVVSTRKEGSLDGLRFLLIGQLDEKGEATGSTLVAADAIGVGPGEKVLYATGSSARQTAMTSERPCDAVIMAVVDSWEISGEEIYHKGRDD